MITNNTSADSKIQYKPNGGGKNKYRIPMKTLAGLVTH